MTRATLDAAAGHPLDSYELHEALWMPYKLFPYETRLGVRELERLGDVGRLVERATYFEAVATADGERFPTHQALVEQLHSKSARQGRASRQPTRYGLHGVHEYKGKFNPQVVRALCNVVDPDADLLVDPFCGSGTALIEGLRLGMDVHGIDRSPMAWFLASAKLDATLSRSPSRLARELLLLGEEVGEALDRGQAGGVATPLGGVLADSSTEYLKRWFTEPAFAALSRALALLHRRAPSVPKRLALVALSSVIRQVSLQLPEDLRIRRRPEPYVAPPIAPLFAAAVDRIHVGLGELEGWPDLDGRATIERGSAEDPRHFDVVAGARRRLILTSPPYATALPYIDTDRLSMVVLGLADAGDLSTLERDLLGSREWTRKQQNRWDARRIANRDELPRSVTDLLGRIERLNREGEAGFRRRAVPSLLYRYFAQMGDVIATWRGALADGEAAVLIVGHNRTTAGGEKIDIPTPALLGDVAESRGFEVRETIELETWPRYGLHSGNGVPGEDAVVMVRKG